METTRAIQNSKLRERIIELIDAAKKVVSKHDSGTLGVKGDSIAVEKLRDAIESVDPLDD